MAKNNTEKGEEGEQGAKELVSQIPSEVLKDIPEEVRPKVIESVEMMMAMERFPLRSPLHDKITPEHIGKIIDNADKDSDRLLADRSSTRRYIFWGAVVILLAFAALLIFFQTQQSSDLVINLIIGLFAFLGGVGGGFAISKFT